MTNLTTKLAVTAIAIASFVSASLAQFEGTIEFKKITPIDTIRYVLYAKGNLVRLDEIDGAKSTKPSGTSYYDLATGKIKALSYDRKLWFDQKSPNPTPVGGKPEITNTKVTKKLLGVDCKELVVNNKDENANVTYYVGGSKFEFFPKFLAIVNRKEKSAIYFPLLKDLSGGGFPYLSIWKDGAGAVKERLEVTKLEKKTLEGSMFEIPADFKKFEKN